MDKSEKSEVKYMELLKKQYPTRQAVCREIINLNAILTLPKGTEHFMSDLHGEYQAFLHIMNNCSGVIKEKVDLIFGNSMSKKEKGELCTLIYYPHEKLEMMNAVAEISKDWYRLTLDRLVAVAKLLSSKYTRSKVRKAMPVDFSYVIDELLHVQKDEDDNQVRYHDRIYDTIIDIGNANEFIIALSDLIKRLAVDHLHIVGDIFDRGGSADRIFDLLLSYHSLDIQWGNHDILWMGAACGSEACIANVLKNNLKYKNIRILENAYGISLRRLISFAVKNYGGDDEIEAAHQAISVMLFKLEGSIIKRHPEYGMDDYLFLDKIDKEKRTVLINGKEYGLNTGNFPTLDPQKPFELSEEESDIIKNLRRDFMSSKRLKKHIRFLYEKGSLYRVYNGNLIFHGCVPMEEDGEFMPLFVDGVRLSGKQFYDRAEAVIRRAFYDGRIKDDLDFMWFMWGGEKSPLCGRRLTTFQRMYIDDKSTWEEPQNPYYRLYFEERICDRILHEFGLFLSGAHIINGHTPVHATEGEKPIRAGGKLLVIDGGFCKKMNETTGTAGYTLIFNSHGLRLKAHHPFTSVEDALLSNSDIESDSELVDSASKRILVRDTDDGERLHEELHDLYRLLNVM